MSTDLAYIYGTEDTDYDPLQDDDNMLNHGTKVAGIIAGVCESAKLVSLKIMSGSRATGGGGTAKTKSSYACRAIVYAEENDIMILNMSVGWAGTSINNYFEHEDGYYDQAMCSVLEQYSGLLICSAGNNSRNIDDNDAEWDIYPQQYEYNNLLVVGASTQYDTKKSNSNWGSDSVDIFAPGDNISTTVKGGGRGTMSDISAAAPMVAGVAAIILSMYPDLSDEMIKVKEYIVNYADGTLSGVTAFTWICDSGGRLNALKAVEAAIEDNTPDAPEPCQHDGEVYYTQYNDSSHRVKCHDCDEVLYTEEHEGYNTNYGSSGHMMYCSLCAYNGMQDHDRYISAIYNDVYTIKCHECSYVNNCNCDREYVSDGSS